MVTGWPLTSGWSKLRRTVKSCWLRDAGICLPLSSTTRDTFSALLSSKAAEVMLSSSGMKRTLALAVRDWVAGETSASIVYCSTSMRERRSCAQAAEAPSARARTAASVRLRNMSDLSFQNFPDGERGALRRGGAAGQLLPHFGQPGLHFGAGAAHRRAGAGLRAPGSRRSSDLASARAPRRVRRSGSPSNKTAHPPETCRPASWPPSPCRT